MKTYAHLGRAALFTVALAIVGASVSVAHDPKGDVAQLQREVAELRAEKNSLQDQNIDLARRFDTEKMRLQREKDELLKQSALDQRQLALMQARLEVMERQQAPDAAGAPAAPAASPLDGKVIQMHCNGAAMREVAEFLQDVAGVPVEAVGFGTCTLSLRTPRGTPLRDALDLIVLNVHDETGELVEAEWAADKDGAITIRLR